MARAEEQDVVIVGGGPAGLTAALYLGRARKRVAVVDAGNPRHAVSEGVHNFITRDGLPPAELRHEAWRQMAAYP
ncbi:MAG: FAD-dependent oxidoreductase, partial [Myxococcota bacterium]